MKKKQDKTGKKVYISAIIEEHLFYADKEWFTLRFENGSTITIRTHMCKELKIMPNI
jgi:hypothetical protein